MSSFEERAELLNKSTETHQLKYQKTRQFATGEGDRYEERTLALVFLRCLREGVQFFLSSNDAAGGKFDDLVLYWNSNESPDASALFAQLKHKTSTKQTTIRRSHLMHKKDNKSDFSLYLYHESYTKMIDRLYGGSYALVLSTNIDLDKDAQHMFVRDNPESVPGMKLLESGGRLYRLNPQDEDVKLAVEDDGRFMKHFYLFCNQSSSKTSKGKLYTELEQLLGADESSCKAICENLCSSLREWMNTQDFCLTSNWEGWLSIVDRYIKGEVTTCNSILTRIRYSCVESIQAYIQGRNPAWIRPPGEKASALTATKIHQAIRDETHIVVSVTHLTELEKKIVCCWGPFCRWLVLVDDVENSYDALLRMGEQTGTKRRLVIVSYKGDDSFLDTCKSDDICDDNWKGLIDLTIRLNSEQQLCRLEDLCCSESLKALLDGKPEALIAMSQLSGPVRMGQDLDPLPGNHISRQITFRMRIRQEFFSSLGDKEVCIMDEVSYKHLTENSVSQNTVRMEELEMYLSASDTLWPLFVVNNDIDRSAIQLKCSKHAGILLYVLRYVDDEWEILFLHRSCAKIRLYVEEQSRSLLQTVNALSNRIIVEGQPGVGKSTMLLDVASQLKGQHLSWWILRIDLLKYSEVFDSCESGVEASKEILKQAIYNEKDLGLLEHSLLQYCLLEYPRIICMVDGFDEVWPDYADKCLQALQELAPRRGKLLVTTRPFVTGRLEGALGVLAHSLPAFSEEQLHEFHGWSRSHRGANGVIRDLLKIPLFSRMYAESLESGIMVNDILSLYENFFERKFRRLYEEKWCANLHTAGMKKRVERERMEHEKQLGFLAVSHLLPKLEVPRHVQPSSIDRTDLLKAGVIYQFIGDKPIFIHRTFAEHFLAKWCFSINAGGLCENVYCKAFAESSLEFFVESFDRMASRDRPLLMTVLNGTESEAKTLLEKGADPAERDVMGRNSLHLVAGYNGDCTILRLLVERLETAGMVKAGGSASGPAEVTREAVGVEAVSEGGEVAKWVEERKTKEPKEVVSDDAVAEAFGAGKAQGDEDTMGGLAQYVEGVGAVTAVLGAEDGLLHWTPLRYAAERRRWVVVSALLQMGAHLHHLGDFQRGLHSPEELWDIFEKDGYKALFYHIILKNESVWRPEMVEQRVEHKCLEIQAGVSIVCAEMSAGQYQEIQHEARSFGDMEVAKLVMLKVLYMQKKSTSLESPSLELHQGSGGTSQLEEWKQMSGHRPTRFRRTFEKLRRAPFHRTSQQPTTEDDGLGSRDAPDETLLHDAARRDDAECLRQLIEAGADVNIQNNNGETAAHFAAVAGNVDCLRRLHSAGADVNMKDRRGQTPLHYAAAMGSAQSAKLLLAAGADALEQDSKCRTPLHLAVIWGNAECVKLLARAVKNLELRDMDGLTALHYAARNGEVESLKLLLRAGAHNSPVNDTLETPLHLAAYKDQTECVRQLLQEKADLTARNADGKTPLHVAAEEGNPDCVRLMLDAGSGMQEKDKFGFTPLHLAAVEESLACVRLLAEGGADVHDTNNNGDTPLHLASGSFDTTGCVKRLLQDGARVTTKNNRGNTPLHIAAYVGNAGSVGLLLEAGADIEQVNEDGDTPLHLASLSADRECVRRLLEAGARVTTRNNRGNTPMHCAAVKSRGWNVKLLLDAGADIEQVNEDGDTPLHLASLCFGTECVMLLLGAGARVTTQGHHGNTPLHCAAMKGNHWSVMLLLDAGADIEHVNEDGDTPLHLASLFIDTKCVKGLLEAGARVTTQNNRGNTPLHCAAMQGQAQIVKLLLDAGADMEQVNEDGRTPLYYAATSAHGECVKLLSEYEAVVHT